MLVGLAREACHKSRSDCRIREIIPNHFYRILVFFKTSDAVHSTDYSVVAALKRNIKIRNKTSVGFHHRQDVLIEMVRVNVKQAHAESAFKSRNFPQKRAKPGFFLILAAT